MTKPAKASAPMEFLCEGNCGLELHATKMKTYRVFMESGAKIMCVPCAANWCRTDEFPTPTEIAK